MAVAVYDIPDVLDCRRDHHRQDSTDPAHLRAGSRIANLFKPKSYKKALYPDRGSILARDGRLLAMSLPMYRVYMDCTVRKREFEELKNSDSPKQKQKGIDGEKEVERKGQGTGRRPCQA